jgi:hypothetical protein
MHADLGSIRISKVQPTLDLQSMQVVSGPLKEQREKILSRLRELEKAGVGVAPFVKAFSTLEAQVAGSDEASIKNGIERLGASLDDQEKAAKAAKEARAHGTGGGSAPKVVHTGKVVDPTSRWGYGPTPITAEEAVGDPEGVITRKLQELGPTPEKNPLFLKTLDRLTACLTANGHAGEAAKYQQRAAIIRRSGISY